MSLHARPTSFAILTVVLCCGSILYIQSVHSQGSPAHQSAAEHPGITPFWKPQPASTSQAGQTDNGQTHETERGHTHALFLPVMQNEAAGTVTPTETAPLTATPTSSSSSTPPPSSTPSPTASPLVSPTAPPYLELVRQIGGSANVSVIRGDLAYVGVGPRLITVDVSSPENPIVVGQSEMLADTIRGIALVADYAFIVNGAAFLVMDVSNPAQPELVFTYDGISVTQDVTVVDNIAYVANAQRGVSIFDVTNPRTPQYLTTYRTESLALEVDVVGDLAYVADYYAGVKILDVSQPSTPQLVGRYQEVYATSGIDVVGGVAYVADAMRGLYILDVSDPYSPTFVSVFPAEGAFGDYQYYQDITKVGNTLYVASQRHGLVVFDVNDIASPVIADVLPAQDAIGVTIEASTAYVSDREVGLLIVDVSTPSNLSLSGVYSAGKTDDIAVYGETLYVSNHDALQVYGLDDPFSPLITATIPISGNVFVDAANDMLYVASFVDDAYTRFSVLEIGTPASPVILSTLELPGMPIDISVSGQYAAISYGSSTWKTALGIYIVDISDEHQPRLMSDIGLQNVRSLQVVGNTVYATSSSEGVRIYSIEDPQSPTLTGSYQTPYDAADIEVEAGRAYVSDRSAGVLVLDVGTPGNPTLLGTLNSPGIYQGLTVQNGVVYFITLAEMRAVDLTNPAMPQFLGAAALPGNYGGSGSIKDVLIHNGTAYVDAIYEGFMVVQIISFP